MQSQDPDILFYDGVCGFCDGLVRWLLDRDRASAIVFSPIQGETAARLLTPSEREQLDSVVFLESQGLRSRKSQAFVRVLRKMGGAWTMVALVILIFPERLRDFFYDAFARRRYRWFGKKESCTIPSKEHRKRFLP